MVFSLLADVHVGHTLAWNTEVIETCTWEEMQPQRLNPWENRLTDKVRVESVECTTCGDFLVPGLDYLLAAESDLRKREAEPWQSNPDSWMGDSAPSPS